MMNSDTQIGDNGRELKITYSFDETKWNNFFEGEELEFNSFFFETNDKERNIENEGRLENINTIPALSVSSPKKYAFDMNHIIDGAKKSIKRDNIEKIKRAKTKAIEKRMKENAEGKQKVDNELEEK